MKSKNSKDKSKKKSFFFEDYIEPESLIDSKKLDLVKVSLSRVNFLFFIFFCFVIIFSVKITYLSLSPLPNKIIFSENANKNFIKKRGDILDRNGIILARNIDIYSAGVIPSLAKDKKKLLINLRLIFPLYDLHLALFSWHNRNT